MHCRAKRALDTYRIIGGDEGSPIRRHTIDQALALTDELRRRGTNASVYVAMRYWHPLTDEVFHRMIEDGVERVLVLPLYPQVTLSIIDEWPG